MLTSCAIAQQRSCTVVAVILVGATRVLRSSEVHAIVHILMMVVEHCRWRLRTIVIVVVTHQIVGM